MKLGAEQVATLMGFHDLWGRVGGNTRKRTRRPMAECRRYKLSQIMCSARGELPY